MHVFFNQRHFLDSILKKQHINIEISDLHWRRNQQLVEMGMAAEDTLNLTKVEEKINQVGFKP